MAVLTITADSTPDLDDWGIDSYWSCEDWVAWHKELKKKFGLDEANRLFITEYHKGGFGASSFDCRSFNADFRKYAKENNFFNALYDGLAGLITQPLGAVKDVVSAASNTVSNVADAAEEAVSDASKAADNIFNTIKWVLPVLLVLAAIGASFYVYNRFIKA